MMYIVDVRSEIKRKKKRRRRRKEYNKTDQTFNQALVLCVHRKTYPPFISFFFFFFLFSDFPASLIFSGSYQGLVRRF